MEQLVNVTGRIFEDLPESNDIDSLFDWLNYDNATIYIIPKQKKWFYELNSSFCLNPSGKALKQLRNWFKLNYPNYKYTLA